MIRINTKNYTFIEQPLSLYANDSYYGLIPNDYPRDDFVDIRGDITLLLENN